MPAVRFGATLPQIKRTWADTRAAAVEFERLGFDSLWVNDHLYGVPMPHFPIMEAWTTLAAVGACTERVELGTLVSPVGFRNPALLAKMAATLDNIAGGRVIVGLGGGWFEMEFAGYGFDFPPLATRLAQLDEAATLMKHLWAEPQPTFRGTYYRVDSVFCEPKPVRKPHPPILIGGGGEKVLLRIAAQHADIWNNLAVNQSDLGRKIEKLRAHCAVIDRDPATLIVSQQCMVVIGENEAEAAANREKADRIYGGHLGPGISGTPQQCVDRIGEMVDLGCTMFIVEIFGRDPREPARLFAERVMPAFR
ncbi:TIGR03560 family F420-dependent LLM class oxidoreductase [Candidatus Binatia bacterium]|nr:TIGR03560 family F420-dependent LLM class oxidoreductase [Candidatus Binatia bacterium]